LHSGKRWKSIAARRYAATFCLKSLKMQGNLGSGGGSGAGFGSATRLQGTETNTKPNPLFTAEDAKDAEV